MMFFINKNYLIKETVEQFKNNLITEDNNYVFKNIIVSYYINNINYKPKNNDILYNNIRY